MNEELLRKYIAKFDEILKTDDVVKKTFESRHEKLVYYQAFNYDSIVNMTSDKITEYLKKLWNVMPFTIGPILENNGEQNFKNRLADLLYGDRPFEIRYNEFHDNVKNFRTIGMSEVLTCVYPNEFFIWNNKIKEIFSLLGIDRIPQNEENIDAECYKYLVSQGKIIQKILNETLNTNYNLFETDYFYEVIYTKVIENEKPTPELEEKDDNSNDNLKEEFLSKVYMSEEKYNTIMKVIEQNKNVIIKGAPGVGKTFIAKKLAYSIIGEKDDSRIEFVQFHQSYSYEDFVEGYKPSKTDGSKFELVPGIFTKFRNEKAAKNEDKKYVFLIDEINRGNLSKIFGELLMLIEADKRKKAGKEAKYKIKLASGQEDFYIPDNLYIIGMMNTADRSLEMIDYALRRRFAFINILPAFSKEDENEEVESKVFYEYVNKPGNEEIKRAVSEIKDLNKFIKEKLDEGFMIGHSYFCDLNNPTRKDILDIYEYKIIPLLEEYFYDDKETFDTWKNKLLGTK